MAHRPRKVPPAIDAKWTEMRRKHETETGDFMRKVENTRAELELRADEAKARLLAKHQQEEQAFWSQNGPGSRISMTPAPAARDVQVQKPRKPQGTATPVRGTPASSKRSAPAKTSVPVKKATSAKTSAPVRRPLPLPGPAPALPRMEVSPAQEPARPAKPPARKTQKDAGNDVIILSSDDEEEPVMVKTKPVVPKKTPVISKPANINTAPRMKAPVTPARTPVATKPMLPNTVQQPKTTQESIDEDSTSSDYSNNFASTLPEATLEFFGGVSRAPIAPPTRSSIKEELVQPRSSSVSSRAPLPSTQSQETFHGLPEPTTPSPYQARDPPMTPPFASPGRFTPFTPPITPGFGSWSDGSNPPASSFSPQGTGTRQEFQRQASFGSNSPFAKQMPFGRPNTGPGSPFQAFSGPAAGTAPPTSPFGLQRSAPSNFGTFSSEAAFADQPVKNYASLANKQGGLSLGEVRAHKDPATSDGAQQMSVDVPTHGIINTEPASKTSANVVETKTVNVDNHGQSTPEDDVRMLDAAQVSSKDMASLPNTPILPDQEQGYLDARPSIERPQTPTRQLPSPPPSHASVGSEQIKSTNAHVKTPESAFKLPTAPASAAAHARHSVAPEAGNIRAGTVDSRASSFTLPAPSRSERGLSVASHTSRDSARTGMSHTRKRPMEYSLSDDDDDVSDYAPSDPDSPSVEATNRAIAGRNSSVIKKSKVTSNSSQATQFDKNRAKNGYGFKKPVVTPKPKPAASVASSGTFVRKPLAAPSTAPRKPAPAGVTIGRKGSTFAKAKSTTITKSASKKEQFVPQPSRRRAAMNAENKIQDMYDDAEALETEQAIEDADQLEDARLPNTFRDMSLTPASVDGDESVEMLMERDNSPPSTSTSPLASTTTTSTTKKKYDFPAWTQDRATGDRHLAKKGIGGRYQPVVRDEEDEEEAEISGVEELDLTGDEQTMRHGDGGGEGGRGVWERVRGAMGGYRMI